MRVTPCQNDRRDEACVHTVDTTGILPTYDMEFAATTLANCSNTPVTHHDAEMHVDNTYKYETIYDEEVIATIDFTANNEEFVAATLASSNKETTADTLANYDEKFTIVAVAANDEETAAVYKEENVAVDALATNNKEIYDEEFAITILAAYDGETLEIYDEELAIATLAVYAEETAAVEGERWGA